MKEAEGSSSSSSRPAARFNASGMVASAAERPKLLYVIVEDGIPAAGQNVDSSSSRRLPSSRYTRAALQSTIQFMGCKPRHAFKISIRVFDVLRNEPPLRVVGHPTDSCDSATTSEEPTSAVKFDAQHSCRKPPKPSQRRSMVLVSRDKFLDVVCEALAEYQYVGPNQRADLMLACRFRERKTSVTVLLCGTSGCGKSTLSSLLASRLGITTVVSTDSIRHMMRSFVDEKTNPLLWASTYHAGEYLDPVAVREATLKRKATKVAPVPEDKHHHDGDRASTGTVQQRDVRNHVEHEQENSVSSKTMVVQGFKAQCEMVIDSLDRLITSWEQRNESVVVEGVHLSLNFVMGLMRKHPSIIPFMIYISNEEKHLERFAVRAKYMTLDPSKNKYAKYIRNIRTIQEYLCKRADKHLVPKINNTNVDKSVAGIHATIFSCLRRREAAEQLYDPFTNTVKVIDHEYQNQYAASSMGSKGMFQLIQRKGSSHHLMALMNVDGSVAKAWPLDSSVDADGKLCSSCNGESLFGPLLQISKAEPVNLQFGNFGLSAFRETGETSSSSAGDGQSSKGENHEFNSSRSSISSTSPRHGEVAEKEAVDEAAVVFVSEEEPDDTASVDSDDEELAEDGMDHVQDEEIDGSVNESVRSDEDAEDAEYNGNFEDNDGYWSEEQLERVEAQVFNIDPPAALRSGAADSTKVDGFVKNLCNGHSNNHSCGGGGGGHHHRRSNSNSPPGVLCGKMLHSRTKSLPHQVTRTEAR